MSSDYAKAQVRPGAEGDLPALTDLYNQYVRETPITFDTAVLTPDDRRPWLLSHPVDGPYRLMVATTAPTPAPEAEAATATTAADTGRILGYATSSPFRAKPAYATSVETTVYVAPDAGGRGIGSLLYTALFEALAGEDLHRAYAGIAQPNEASTRLHRRFGFRHTGTFREVGRKFDRYWDVAWYEKEL
ncbi:MULTISPECIES: GNAT family N-acetyltransferase [unclassified Streptomyces]|uniref:GNAT family N-acetyltransferase n=1 Tax=unclassified Streptomyces TaxID=2593676 RepID=UPI0005AAD1EF|nr:GNAT family N-acetyltransferase [Streptomyces sp. NBRC 110035]